jgi:hypothetical protein
LSAWRGVRLGAPGVDGFIGEPNGEASALAQSGIILPPVRHPMPLFRDVVAAIGVGFERHDWDPGVLQMEAGDLPMWGRTAEPSPANTARRCNPGPQILRSHALGSGTVLFVIGLRTPPSWSMQQGLSRPQTVPLPTAQAPMKKNVTLTLSSFVNFTK